MQPVNGPGGHTFILRLTFLFIALTMGQNVFAQSETPIIIPNMQGEITIDGELDEAQWETAKVISLSYVTRPFENTAPPVNTQVRVIENSETLYISFKASDPNPEAINAFFRDRDRVWDDDLVGIKLDTFNDSRLAYQFFTNPLGIQADSIENEMTGRESDSWDAIWQSSGKITKDGFQVEMAIPLRILNFKEGSEHKIWGAEFVRFYPRTERFRISNLPRDRNNSCNLCQLSEVSGFKQAQQSQNLALVPTLVVGRGRSRDPEESFNWDYSDNQEIGLDVKWGITPEVSLQATLNPDFSQVESDVAQLSINNTFALFFDEKRPFFLENADYFSSNFNLVYTRNIGAPDYGAKVTGRIDDHTLGVFVANDENTTFLVPGNLGSSIAELETESINVALRYRYDYSDDFSIGLVSTLRDADNYHNYVFGFDSKYQITNQDTLRVQIVGSETEYPVDLYKDFCDTDDQGECLTDEILSESALRVKRDDAFRGEAFRINYRHEERDWNFRVDHVRNGKDFRADLGFQSRVDRNTSVLGAGYNWYSEDTWWNRIELFGDWDISHNDEGDLLEKEAEVYVSLRGKWQSYFELGVAKRDRVGIRQEDTEALAIDDLEQLLAVDGQTTLFTENSASFFFDMRPVRALQMSAFMRYGDQVDFANNRLGKQLQLNPRFTWSIGKHLQFRFRHTYRDLEVDGAQLFTANLTDARLTYQFDQRQFLRLIMVYSDIERNQDNYTFDVDSRDRSLGAQLLYSYKINPLTKFFIGYSDAGFRNDTVTSLTTSEQSVFMKVSYAWLQ